MVQLDGPVQISGPSILAILVEKRASEDVRSVIPLRKPLWIQLVTVNVATEFIFAEGLIQALAMFDLSVIPAMLYLKGSRGADGILKSLLRIVPRRVNRALATGFGLVFAPLHRFIRTPQLDRMCVCYVKTTRADRGQNPRYFDNGKNHDVVGR